LIRVNCATIPAELFESEFFGHVKGSFTGAVRDRVGRFQAADGGTLFLDEVGEIPLKLQSKLLRVLQEGEFESVGEERTRSVDVRIIAATNRDLKQEVSEGRFREDLFYRLGVFPIEVPALRDRRDDIGILADHLVRRIAEKFSIQPPPLKKKHVRELESYDWPGNIRELENAIERALIAGHGELQGFGISPTGTALAPKREANSISAEEDSGDILTADEMKALERRNILSALVKCGWKIGGSSGAAALLNMKPTTLSSKMKALAIRRND
jgi:transcriptional regulator with GAF, ATPase, and Fis domain